MDIETKIALGFLITFVAGLLIGWYVTWQTYHQDKKRHEAFKEGLQFSQMQRYGKIIDDYKELIHAMTYKCDAQATCIKELEQDRTLIINGDIKGTDTDGGVKGEKGEEGKV